MQPWLNYHHLLYFWTVVREGGVSAASRRLKLAQPTVSAQIKALEDSLGVPLFHRSRGKLVLTETGARVFGYADQIFALGRELRESVARDADGQPARLVVGVADEVPKLIVEVLVRPALEISDRLRVICYEDRQDRLLAELATYALDVVIAEAPAMRGDAIRAHSHLLGESELALFASRDLARKLRRGFPASLDRAPFLLPIEGTIMRTVVTTWLAEQRVRPDIRAEFQDSALLGVFARAGRGVFAAPQVIASEVQSQYDVELVGNLGSVRQRYYAITAEKRIEHAAVRAITESARGTVFAR